MIWALIAISFARADYPTTYPSVDNPWNMTDILYDRSKCTTCCRVLFASDYNYETDAAFTDEDDENGHTRFVMDMEFDDVSNVRKPVYNYEQCILLRPIKKGNELQFFEFAPYKMYTSYPLPKRVHDIRHGASEEERLIIWKKKPPLDAGTNNQRFVYVHPYDFYDEDTIYSNYPYHFYLPFYKYTDLCYEACVGDDWWKWKGNNDLTYSTDAHQIRTVKCADSAKQRFIPVFA
ncbi:Galactose-inhibitable lectin 35 kDa subunit [Entamoeba marina]